MIDVYPYFIRRQSSNLFVHIMVLSQKINAVDEGLDPSAKDRVLRDLGKVLEAPRSKQQLGL